jgi:hypothetical protein
LKLKGADVAGAALRPAEEALVVIHGIGALRCRHFLQRRAARRERVVERLPPPFSASGWSSGLVLVKAKPLGTMLSLDIE